MSRQVHRTVEDGVAISGNTWQDVGSEIKVINGSIMSLELFHEDSGDDDAALTDVQILGRVNSEGAQYTYVDGDRMADVDVAADGEEPIVLFVGGDAAIKTLDADEGALIILSIGSLVGIQVQVKGTADKTATMHLYTAFGER